MATKDDFVDNDKTGETDKNLSMFDFFESEQACFQLPPLSDYLANGSTVKLPPPPSYDEATSTNPRLFCVDFFPELIGPGDKRMERCPQFAPFSTVMQNVNHWLRSITPVEVVRCECVERMADFDGNLHVEQTLQFEPGMALRIYITGVRIWYTQNFNPGSDYKPDQIWHFNALPKIKFSYTKEMFMGLGMRTLRTKPITNITIETLSAFNKNINKKLEKDPLPGSILNTSVVPFRMNMNAKAATNLDVTVQWHKTGEIRILGYLHRIFYKMGPPANENVYLKCFAPVPLAETRYEPLTELTERAFQFCKLLDTESRVTDIQTTYQSTSMMGGFNTFDTDPDIGLEEDVLGPSTGITGQRLMRTSSEQTYEMHADGGMFCRREYRCVRVAYVTPNICKEPLMQTGMLTSQIYLPARLGHKNYETHEGLLTRVLESIANQTRTRVMFIDTLMSFISIDSKKQLTESTFRLVQSAKGRYRLTALRIVFDGPAVEIPEPIYTDQNDSTTDNSCCCLML